MLRSFVAGADACIRPGALRRLQGSGTLQASPPLPPLLRQPRFATAGGILTHVKSALRFEYLFFPFLFIIQGGTTHAELSPVGWL